MTTLAKSLPPTQAGPSGSVPQCGTDYVIGPAWLRHQA